MGKNNKETYESFGGSRVFSDFLALRLGQPDQLSGYANIRYSLHVALNVRLILWPNATQDTVMICTEMRAKG